MSAVVLLGLMVFCIGCSKDNIFEIKTNANRPINRSFKDLTLGMEEGEFKHKLVYGGPIENSGHYKEYIVYSQIDRVETGRGLIRMENIKNVYLCYCDFFNGKLFRFAIEYENNFQPKWGNFVANAKDKYGEGKESLNEIKWDDGKTNLAIGKVFGEQGLNFTNYGEHYVVVYTDKELDYEKDRKEKEQAPNF